VTTRLVDDRYTGLRIGYLATDWSSPVSFEDYQDAMQKWAIEVIEKDGQPIGAVYRSGDELHVSVLPDWRRKWVTKSILRQLFNRDRITTRVAAGHDYMYGILKRLGFEHTIDNWMVKEQRHGY
jgi:GNAT superfamily N-acetyltransferase